MELKSTWTTEPDFWDALQIQMQVDQILDPLLV